MNKLFITVALCLLAAALYAQDYSYEVAREPVQNGDVNGDGIVNVADILIVIIEWGVCSGCPSDVNGDGSVNVNDLLIVIANWG